MSNVAGSRLRHVEHAMGTVFSFDVRGPARLDPTGLVKGWAVERAAHRLVRFGADGVCLNGGWDLQLFGGPWRVGIADPLRPGALVAVVNVPAQAGWTAVATSGTAERGCHIVDPTTGTPLRHQWAGVTVTGTSLTEVDAFATAACAMGEPALTWLEDRPGIEALVAGDDGRAWQSSGFGRLGTLAQPAWGSPLNPELSSQSSTSLQNTPCTTSIRRGEAPRVGHDGAMSSHQGSVEVVEPPIPDRVRRPADALKLGVVLLVLVVSIVLADVAVGTTGALEQDLALATSGIPRLLLQVLSWLSGIGVVVLPLAVGADLIVRGRPMQLVMALAASGAAALVVVGLRALILEGGFSGLVRALTRPLAGGRTDPLDAVIVSMVALLTVADIVGRKWISPLAIVVIGSTVVTAFLSGASTALALFSSLLLGWAIGLAFRFGFGATSTRPPGAKIADALVAAGVPLMRLELVNPDDAGDRRYRGTTSSSTVDAQVMDRDTFGLASGRRLLRLLRLRNGSTRPALTLRAELEHRTLMGLALAQARIPAPRPVAAREVGPFSAVIAYLNPRGTPVSELGADLDDAQLALIWRMHGTLLRLNVAHRGLGPDVVMLTDDGRAGLLRVGGGDIAADELTLRIDTAQLLTTVGLAVGAERAVRAATAELGEDAVARALPLLQPIAMTPTTRAALKEHKGLLGSLRDEIQRRRPAEEAVEPIELRRVTLRGLVTVIGGGVAAYLLLTQLAQVDLPTVVANASMGWALATVFFAALTFVGASLALTGSVNLALRFVRTYMTQLAVAFSGLVAPAAIGNIALNTRYLQKSGADPAVAGASVGVAQLAQFCSYFVLLIVSGVLAGTGPRASFTPPAAVVAAVPIFVLVVLVLLAVRRVRRLIAVRVVPRIRTVVPQVLSVLQHPRKLTQLLGGALLLDLSFVAALVCATRAFGATQSVAAIAVVYFAGAIIGSAVPTPGGLGGIEAAISAGLIAIGLDGGTAVSSVLLYRLATYWLPIPFGWYSLNRLQKVQAI